jgi:hypothetical protein
VSALTTPAPEDDFANVPGTWRARTLGCELTDKLEVALLEAETKAWDALGRYKFQMFGYWAAIWVHLNRVSGGGRPNPFAPAVHLARGLHRGEFHAAADVEIPEGES